jgi:rhodanese-related sulfurtransferase
MPDKTLSRREVLDLLSTNDNAAYIDVRTVAEFAAGHPRGRVVNIPIVFYHPTTREIYPNNSFLEVVASVYDKDKPLIIGGDDGERTERAAVQLRGAGYTNIWIMPEGVGGWRAQKLATTTDNRNGVSYASLLSALKRKGKKQKVGAQA